MTEKQIEKIRQKIKRCRADLVSEKRKFGGFHDGSGLRYYISDLYLQIGDYKGTITYKKWFDKNFPDDIGDAQVSLNWSIAYHGLGMIVEAEIYTIDTAFKNVYLHSLLLDREISRIDMYDQGFDTLEYTKTMIETCKKISTKPYLDWLTTFIDTDRYKEPINKFIALNKLLKDENIRDKRIELLDHIRDLENINKNRKK
jgi:hypothetical protein